MPYFKMNFAGLLFPGEAACLLNQTQTYSQPTVRRADGQQQQLDFIDRDAIEGEARSFSVVPGKAEPHARQAEHRQALRRGPGLAETGVERVVHRQHHFVERLGARFANIDAIGHVAIGFASAPRP